MGNCTFNIIPKNRVDSCASLEYKIKNDTKIILESTFIDLETKSLLSKVKCMDDYDLYLQEIKEKECLKHIYENFMYWKSKILDHQFEYILNVIN